MKKLISIVIPAYNEQEVLGQLCGRLKKFMDSSSDYAYEVIIVENGSKDNTMEELLKARKKDKRIKILQLAKNEGCDGGIMAGLSFATGDAAIVMMSDLQEPPELIPKFTKKWEEGYDIVYGIVKKRKNIPVYKIIGSLAFYRIMNLITKGSIPENVSDFRLMDRRVYSVITQLPEHNKFFRGIAVWVGFRQIGIPFERPERAAGKSKADLFTILGVALNGILSFSYLALRLPWAFTIILGLLTVVALVLFQFQIFLFLLGFTIISFILSIQSEYIMKIMDEARNRPNFIVSRQLGISSKEK